jgi:hypothetical protein
MSFVSNSLSSSNSSTHNSNKANLHKESFLLYAQTATAANTAEPVQTHYDYKAPSSNEKSDDSYSANKQARLKLKRGGTAAAQVYAKTSFLFSNELLPNNPQHSGGSGNRDDSLNDVLSIDKQTPFQLENDDDELNNASIDEILLEPNMLTSTHNNLLMSEATTNNNSSEDSPKQDKPSNRIAFFKNKINNLNSQILAGNGTFKTASSSSAQPHQKQQQTATTTTQRSRIPTPVQSQFKSSNQKLNESLNNELIDINFAESGKLAANKPAKNPPVQFKDETTFELIKTPQPEFVDDDLLSGSCLRLGSSSTSAKPLGVNKNGAFKIYNNNNNNETFNENSNMSVVSSQKSLNPAQSVHNRISPFFSIDRVEEQLPVEVSGSAAAKAGTLRRADTEKVQSTANNTVKTVTSKKAGHNPARKYRSGSVASQPLKAGNKGDVRNNEQVARPSTLNDITYSLDSDESITVDDLMNDPDRLRMKLKQSKLNKDQLVQLQEDYVKLLEQYAEAENFIDAFRLTGQMTNASITPNFKMFQVTVFNFF